MSYKPPEHICQLRSKRENIVRISRLNAWQRFLYLPSTYNTKTKIHLRSLGDLMKETRRIARMQNKFIHPLSMFRVVWNTFYIFIGLMSFWIYPLNICFSTHAYEMASWLGASVLFCQFMTIVDIILSQFTGYYEEANEQAILKGSKIVKRYWSSYRNWLVLITAIPFGIPLYFLTTNPLLFNLFNILLCLKFAETRRILKYIDELLNNFNLNPIKANLFIIIVIGAIIVHCTGCAAFAIPIEAHFLFGYEITESSWSHEFDTRSDLEVYIDAIFRAISLMITIGHDELITKTSLDSIAILVLLVPSEIFMKMSIVYVLDVIHVFTASAVNYEMELDQIHSYMSYKQLSIETQTRILDYYDYKFEKNYLDETAIVYAVDEMLSDIQTYIRFKMIKAINALTYLDDSIADEIVTHMKEEIFLPNDIIIKSNTRGNCMYFLYSGTVCVKTPNGKEICHLPQKSYFGEISVIKGCKRSADIIALETCHVFRLDKKVCKKYLFTLPDILQEFKNTAERRINETRNIEETHIRLLMEKTIHMETQNYSY